MSTEPKISLCELSLMDTTLEEDVALALAAGASGLGVIEAKLHGNLLEDQRLLEAAKLSASVCALNTLSILPPMRDDWYPGSPDLDKRLEDLLGGLRRIARLQPDTVLLLTGPTGAYKTGWARAKIVEVLRTLADEANSLGTRIGIEIMGESRRQRWTIVCSLVEALDLIDEVDRENVGIIFDTWHMWDSPGVHETIPRAADRIFGVQISDYRSPTRGSVDRVFAGDGIARIDLLLHELREAGYSGWYDMELFSDDGRFGNDFSDSLWKLPRREFAVRQVEGFRRCWSRSLELTGD